MFILTITTSSSLQPVSFAAFCRVALLLTNSLIYYDSLGGSTKLRATTLLHAFMACLNFIFYGQKFPDGNVLKI